MAVDSEFTRREILFNSVEIELRRRWAFYNVPPVFARRPVQHLRILVKAWWQLYHEARCARLATNRSVWSRRSDLPAEALDTPALLDALGEIQQLVAIQELLTYRSLTSAEQSSLCLLAMLTDYYANSHKERWIQIM